MIWRQIPGYETDATIYEASFCGKIRSVNEKTGKTYELSQNIQQGYYHTTINGRNTAIHILVALAHISKPSEADDTWTVDHLDPEDKLNNFVHNLRWASSSSQGINRRKAIRGKINSCPVVGIHVDTGEVVKFASMCDAGKILNIDKSKISDCLLDKRSTYGDYIWTTPLSLPDFPNEIWKLWYTSNKYKVLFSNHGRFAYEFNNGYIKKLETEDKNTERAQSEDRYPKFRKYGKEYKFHRIVYELFVGSIPDGMIVHHKNHKKQNAFVDNLELTTRSKNAKYAYDAGQYDDTKSARVSVQIDGVRYESYTDAQNQIGVPIETIRYRIQSPNFPEYKML